MNTGRQDYYNTNQTSKSPSTTPQSRGTQISDKVGDAP